MEVPFEFAGPVLRLVAVRHESRYQVRREFDRVTCLSEPSLRFLEEELHDVAIVRGIKPPKGDDLQAADKLGAKRLAESWADKIDQLVVDGLCTTP